MKAQTAKRRWPLLVAAVAAGILLLVSTVGGARAALTIKSDEYEAEFSMYHIGIQLNENDKPVAWRYYQEDAWHVDEGSFNGTASLLAGIEEFSFGTTYPEVLTVTNNGAIDEYVRVTIRRYWLDEDGSKLTELDPSLIDLHLTEGSGWIIDETMDDPERIVLYYTKPLAPWEETPACTDTITVSGDIKKSMKQTSRTDENGHTVVTNTYTYDGATFCIDVEADGVQTHNAEDAISSAWGRAVTIDESGSLSFK